MFKLISFLISGCWHQWEKYTVLSLKGEFGGWGNRIIYECKKCGGFKKKDLI